MSEYFNVSNFHFWFQPSLGALDAISPVHCSDMSVKVMSKTDTSNFRATVGQGVYRSIFLDQRAVPSDVVAPKVCCVHLSLKHETPISIVN